MATWQQGNSGGLLGGIGQVNANAPQSSDINATLGLIRDNNDFARSGGNNVALTGLQGLVGVAEQYQQQKQKEALGAFNQAHADAWKTGDTSKLRDFAVANPAFVAQAQQAVAGLNEQQRADIGTQAAGLRMAIAQGPEAFAKYVTSNAPSLARIGADPNSILQMGIQSPEQAQHLVDTIGMASLGGKDYFDTIDKQQGRVIDRDKLAETVRSNKAGEGLQARGQNLSYQSAMTGHNLAAQRLSLDQQEFGLKVQQAQQKAQQLISDAPKLSVNMEKSIEKSVNDSTASLNSANSMSALAQQFRQEKPTTGIFGSANNMFSKLTGSETALRDLRIRQNSIVNSQVLKFLPPGPATDRDVAIAREGAPSTWDDPELVANWLDANARLERRAAQFNDFKAEWMSANGNPGQSRNGGAVLGMEVKKGESLGSAARRYMAQNPIAEQTAATKKPELPTYQAKQQYGQTQAQAQQAAQDQQQQLSDDDLVSKYLGGR